MYLLAAELRKAGLMVPRECGDNPAFPGWAGTMPRGAHTANRRHLPVDTSPIWLRI